jgi:hypothetical protein
MPSPPITRVVLYKHGVGYFEREGAVTGDATLELTFRQNEVSDVLKSLTVLDLAGGHVSAVAYDSTKPLDQLLAEVAITIPDQGSLGALLPQLKGARVGVAPPAGEPREGVLIGVDFRDRPADGGVAREAVASVLTDAGELLTFDLFASRWTLLDSALRRDLEFYLRTQLSAKKKDARTFTFFAEGEGERRVRLSYVLEAPVWKATYRILLGEEGRPPTVQGWAVVDNTQDEDWENVELALVAGLPVSFVHDLYTPRSIRRPTVAVQETSGVLPPMVEEGVITAELTAAGGGSGGAAAAPAAYASRSLQKPTETEMAEFRARRPELFSKSAVSSTPTQVRERQVGDLFEYHIEHPVTVRRNQSALVPIVLKPFDGRSVLLYQKAARADNPLRCVELTNTTGLTLEGGPVTVLEAGSYVGEAMLDTTRPADQRLLAYAVELAVKVLDSIDSHDEPVRRVIVRKGVLKAQYLQLRQTTYTFRSKSAREQVVYLDHPRDGRQWRLTDTPAPHETTDNHWRFRFDLPAEKTTKFVVKQQQTLSQQYQLIDVTDDRLAFFLEQKYLDAAAAAALRQALELRRQLAGVEARIAALDAERDGIHAEQKRIRENLGALSDRAGEKALRERLVRTLEKQEDRLEAIVAERQQLLGERDAARARLDAALAALEYEGEVG